MPSGFHLPRVIAPLLAGVLLFQGFSSAGARRAPKKGTTMTQDQRVAHVLSRLTFGARPGDFEKVKAMGVEAFTAQQLDPDLIDNSAAIARLRKLQTLNMATPAIIEQYTPPKPPANPSPAPAKSPEKSAVGGPAQSSEPKVLIAGPSMEAIPDRLMPSDKTKVETQLGEGMHLSESMTRPGDAQQPVATQNNAAAPKPTPPPKNPQMVVTELQRAKLLRAVYSDRQLYELMVDFWENHFSIFANKDDDRYLLTGFDRETIRPFALARFRDLLGATAHSPAMLFYLDNWRSSVPRPYPAKGDKPAVFRAGQFKSRTSRDCFCIVPVYTTMARRLCWGTRFCRVAASPTANVCSTFWRRIHPRPASSRPNLRAASSAMIRHRPLSIGRRQYF